MPMLSAAEFKLNFSLQLLCSHRETSVGLVGLSQRSEVF
jgi:hypothetical protein